MANLDGGLSSFKFGSTVYQCLQDFSWSGSVTDLVAKCSGSSGATTTRRAGTPDDQFTFTVVLDAQDITKINALRRGQNAAFEFHPEGDSAGNVEFVATDAVVLSSNISGGADQITLMPVTIGINGALTVQAAS